MTRVMAVSLIAAIAVAVTGCGASGPSSGPSSKGSGTTATPPVTGQPEHSTAPPSDQVRHPSPGPGSDRFSEDAGDIGATMTAAVRRYVAAIDRHDGRGVCAALVPGALEALRFPAGRDACARAMSAAIGHAVRGGPAWRRTTIVRIKRVEVDPEHPGEGRVEATVLHTFRGRREPSIEDDLVYLTRSRGSWLLLQPSATLYRAIGYRTPPLSSLVPPAP